MFLHSETDEARRFWKFHQGPRLLVLFLQNCDHPISPQAVALIWVFQAESKDRLSLDCAGQGQFRILVFHNFDKSAGFRITVSLRHDIRFGLVHAHHTAVFRKWIHVVVKMLETHLYHALWIDIPFSSLVLPSTTPCSLLCTPRTSTRA